MGRSPWPVCSQPPRPPPCIPQGLVSSSATDVASGNRPTGGCKKAHPGPEHAAEAGSGPRNPPRSWDRAGKFSLWLSWHRVWDGKLYPGGTPQGCHFWWTQTVGWAQSSPAERSPTCWGRSPPTFSIPPSSCWKTTELRVCRLGLSPICAQGGHVLELRLRAGRERIGGLSTKSPSRHGGPVLQIYTSDVLTSSRSLAEDAL